ncbi:diguanylate cyclase [Comamonas piscis]|uniref:diguanylate cyclase n=1 Tax=Comamonas piscis TaxID=1562974 RepID=A0A7G5EN39_9BURK|nr:GGDEF domain-containing protein [Comamonas piscis]QMV75414.1 diguanylate cyclase [Comamonas piscis]WSO33921.1 diguanylate cyclase [Comamonas piscis]
MQTASPFHPLEQPHSGRLLLCASLAVFAAAMVGILLRPLGYLSVFWPANQIVLVLLLRYPRLMRPLGLAALFASFVLADLITGTSLWLSLGFTTANLCGAACGWLFLRKQSQRDLQMEGQYSALLVFFASGMASLASAAIGGPVSVWAFGLSLTQGLLMWWTGEWMNAMMLLPFLLALPSARTAVTAKERRSWALKFLPALAVVGLEITSYMVGNKVGSLVFSLPALLWCALSYRILTTAIITMVVFVTKVIVVSNIVGFIPANVLDVASLRLGITMLLLGPLSVAGAHAARTELLHRMRYQAHHDSLTDVLSRNGFVQASHTLLKRLTHEGNSAAVLMLDLDHFKRVNDNHGHASGDRLLRDVSQLLTASLRPQDVLGRIGGEEFAVVLPTISFEDATAIAERLCQTVRSGQFQTAQDAPLQATLSIGLAYRQALRPGDSLEALLREADLALYQAKAQGRDCAVWTVPS